MAKYDLMPMASTTGTEKPNLRASKRWLLIQPSPDQLPAYAETIAHLGRGGDLTVLFGPEQAASPDVLKWLAQFGLVTQRSIGLMVSDGTKSANGSFLGGRGSALGRDMRVVTAALPASRLNGYEADQLFQSYTLRPTAITRTSGLLNLSFVSDQFADDAVGEVWEGIHPSSLGKLRERQLAAILRGDDRPGLMPDWIARPEKKSGATLTAYLVTENGGTALSGKFPVRDSGDPVIEKFRSLRDQAYGFVQSHCPRTGPLTQCETRLLGQDMIEWMVSWRSARDGKIDAIELLHERRLYGLGSTWNVVFGN
ncbi:MAG: hypothetical protein AAB356_08760 [Deltaproteobacteria bacterium]